MQGDFAIEDMFPDDFYVRLAEESHKDKLANARQKNIPLPGNGLLCVRVARGCEEIGIKFNKGSVAKAIRRELSMMHNTASLPSLTVEKAERLFIELNRIFDRH